MNSKKYLPILITLTLTIFLTSSCTTPVSDDYVTIPEEEEAIETDLEEIDQELSTLEETTTDDETTDLLDEFDLDELDAELEELDALLGE